MVLPCETSTRWHIPGFVSGLHLPYAGNSEGIVGTYGRSKRDGKVLLILHILIQR